MAIKAVIGILISACVLITVGGIVLAFWNASRGRKVRSGIVLIVVGVVGILALAPLNAGLVLIQPNEVGVVFRQTASGDAALLEPLQPGLKWVVPFVDKVVIYNVGQQSITMAGSAEFSQTGVMTGGERVYSAVRAISSDGQVVVVDATVIFRIDKTRINDIHRNWRSEYIDGFIIAQARSAVRNALTGYGAEEIYSGGRATLETEISEDLRDKYAREGFLLTDVLIRDIVFIEQKQIAEQEARRAAFRVQQAEQEAEQARVEAQGRADAAVIAAEGEAKAIVLKGEADAEALDLINEILSKNPNLIQYEYINRLGDKVQIILLPSNSPFLFDIESLLDQAGYAPVENPTPVPQPPATEENQP
jgi:regulator of protease activity HflC (stomatin/prohibitin superfamily)